MKSSTSRSGGDDSSSNETVPTFISTSNNDDESVSSKSLLSRSTVQSKGSGNEFIHDEDRNAKRLSSLEYISRRQKGFERIKKCRSPHDIPDPKERRGELQATSSGIHRRLTELRQSKSKAHVELRHVVTRHQESVKAAEENSSTTSKSRRELVEPIVYDDMRAELLSAYETIQAQRELIEQQGGAARGHLPKVSEGDDKNDTVAELRRQISELKRERAETELALRRRVTNESIEHKKSIDHWKREAICWQQRFDDAWTDHEAKIKQLQFESTEWRRQALKSNEDLQSLKNCKNGSTLDLILAKERIAELEKQLRPTEHIQVSDNNGELQASLLESAMKQKGGQRRFLGFGAFSN